MTTLTAYSNASDGYVYCQSTTYATARSGGGSLGADSGLTFFYAGQYKTGPTYLVLQGFLAFTTSSMGLASTVSAATLTLTPDFDGSTVDCVIQARANSFGGSITTADFVPGDNLSTLTLLASRNTSTMTSVGTAYDLTSDAAFLNNINGGGDTEIIMVSDLMIAGTASTSADYQTYRSSDYTGTTSDPKLVVEYTDRDARPWRLHHRSQAPHRASRF